MSFLDFFTKRKPATANLAKERLQVIIAREGNRSSNPELIQQIKRGLPAVHQKETDVAQAYQDAIDRYLGNDLPLRFVDEEDKGFFRRLLESVGVGGSSKSA